MQERLTGTGRSPTPLIPERKAASKAAVVLGIDPSLRGTGYGVIQLARPAPRLLAHGTILCPSHWPRSLCLKTIGSVLRAIVQEHHPTIGVMEGLFYAQNMQTALLMGEARGAALFAAAEGGLEIYEIAPRKVKQAIVGYGAAQKNAVAKMVQRLLLIDTPLSPDAADALALALAYGQSAARFAFNPPKKI